MTNTALSWRRCQRHKAVVFDLDGTLVDSRLDFAHIRADLGLPDKAPILEAIDGHASAAVRERLHLRLLDHEFMGAATATPMPGATGLLPRLRSAGLKVGIFTRNARAVTHFTLSRLAMSVDHIIAREDAPPKPDPAGLLSLCTLWGLTPAAMLFVGDYLYDLEAGRSAGVKTLLYAPTPPDFPAGDATTLTSFDELWSHLE